MADRITNFNGHPIKLSDNGDGTFGVAVRQVGVVVEVTHTHPNVATTTGVVLVANEDRKYALLVNDSDVAIYIKLGAVAVLNQGIRLNANGGSYEMSASLGNLFVDAINAIHGDTGTKVLLVTEGE